LGDGLCGGLKIKYTLPVWGEHGWMDGWMSEVIERRLTMYEQQGMVNGISEEL